MNTDNPIKLLEEHGQSAWLDFIQRNLLSSGTLQDMIDRWGIRGVTTNPAIFEKAISHSTDYDAQIATLAAAGCNAEQIYEALVLKDVRTAADILRATYDGKGGTDGFVSLEVSPHLVHDTGKTVAEAKRFWRLLDRPNAMIKVPGTPAGLLAFRQLIGNGVNVNITLLFSLETYQAVIDAYLGGLEDAQRAGYDLRSIASVASFFVSRIDSRLDPLLDNIEATRGELGEQARKLKGKVAIACARRAYSVYRRGLSTTRYLRLLEGGATPQRLLWASTGTKNPAYSDIKYVESLIGECTVNTMPLATLQAYDDHGNTAVRINDNDRSAVQVLLTLKKLGIDLKDVTNQLLAEGVRKFAESFDALLQTLRHRAE